MVLSAAAAVGDVVPVTTAGNDDVRPRAVYNSVAAEYLVVWQHAYTSSDQDIYLRRISLDGQPLSGEMGVVSSGASELSPAVAYAPADNRYVVAYQYEYSPADHDIYAATVGADAGVIQAGIGITTTGSYEGEPAIAYNAGLNGCLVVWQSRQGSDEFVHNNIYGRWLSAAGAPTGDAFVIAATASDESLPAVAAAANGTCLVVWQARKDPSGDYGIYGRHVGAGGALIGGELALSTWEYDQVRPRATFNPILDEYLVVWEDHHWGWGNDWDIYGHRVSAAGAAVDGTFAIAWENANRCLNPDAAWLPATGQYLVTWEFEYSASDHDVYSRVLSADGATAGDAVAVSTGGAHERVPSPAAADNGSYVIAWEDARNSGTGGMDIYGFTLTAFVPVFSGHVYSGPVGDTTSPLANVMVVLYGSNNEPDIGTYLGAAQSGADGWFSLPAPGNWEYYNLVVQWPQGYEPAGAESIDGVVVASDLVRFTPPLEQKDLAANAFYFTVQELAITYGPVVEQVGRTSATVVWQTNLPADSTVEYGETVRMGSAGSSGALETTHSIVLTNLTPAATYALAIRSADSAGRTVSSRTLFFETSPPADRRPPTLSLRDIGAIQTGTVIAPEVADDTGVQRVEFFIDDLLVFTDFSAPYEFHPAAEAMLDGEHVVKTRAFDIAGNASELTRPASSLKLFDAAVPTVTISSPGPEAVVSGKVRIDAFLTDDSGLRSALLTVDAWTKGGKDFVAPQPKNAPVVLYWDSTEMPNGRHRIAVHAYDVDWKSASATVDVIVNNVPPPPPPKLIVTDHLAIRYGNYVHVGITVENVGGSTARNIVIRDSLLLFQPVARGTTEAGYTCELGPSHKGSDCVIRPTMSILAGNSRMFTYDAVPVLVHPDTITPMIGNEVQLTWDSPTQAGFSTDCQPVIFKTTAGELMLDAHKNAVKSSDYLIVTSPDNLMAFNPAADVNALLSAMAELARLKNGTLGFLYGPPAFYRNYQAHDGLAVGDVLGDDRAEIVVASVAGKNICTYVPDSHDWFWLPEGRCFEPGWPPKGFEAGDRIAVGLLPGGAKEKIVMTDSSSNYIFIYDFNGIVDSMFSVDVEPWDALAVGDVFPSLARAEIIFGDRSAGKIVTYRNTGAKLQEFTKAIDPHDGLAAGDVLGDAQDEIVFADAGDNKIYIFAGSGTQVGVFNCHFDDGDKVAVADVYDVWPNDKEEIIVTTHAADMIRVYKGAGTLMKVIKRPLDAFDGLAAGRILGDNVPYMLVADQSERAIDAHAFTHETDNRHVLIDLISAQANYDLLGINVTSVKPTGQWSTKLKDGWASDGYLLIVGETEIVPAYGDRSFGTLLVQSGSTVADEPLRPDVTDYPYANTYGEEIHPELIIGRIIGNTAKDLAIPIRTSINVATGAGGYGFDRSYALAISGFPAGLGGGAANINFVPEVDAVTKTFTAKGLGWTGFHTPDYAVYGPGNIFDRDATAAAIRNSFFAHASGTDVIFLAAHGNAGGWEAIGASDILGRADPFGSTNPFVFPSSCLTGAYHGTVSFAEALLERRAGVALAATRWGLSSHAWISNLLFETWDPGESVGEAVRDVKRNIGFIAVPALFGVQPLILSDRSALYWTSIYHVFGDPKFGREPLYSPPPDTTTGTAPDAMAAFDVFVPDYEVEHIDGLDHVRIPGGTAVTVQDMPTVPAYRVSYEYPRSARIQDVVLSGRSDPTHVAGLTLPVTHIAAVGDDAPDAPAPTGGRGENTWWPDKPFDWSLTHNPDTTTLIVTVYPFAYCAATGEALFCNQYSFAVDYVESEAEIVSLTADRPTYDRGDSLRVDAVVANPAAEPQTFILSTLITAEADDAAVTALPCRTLRDVAGAAAYSETLDTSALLPGYYRIDTLVSSADGQRLDTRTTTFRIGSPRLEVTALAADPTYIAPNRNITLNMTVQNTGSIAVAGRAILSLSNAAGEIVASFDQTFDETDPGAAVVVSQTWNTAGALDASYTITAYVLYDGCTSAPLKIEICRCSGGLLPGDVNRDCHVNMEDMARLATRWAQDNCGDIAYCDNADIDHNGLVDVADLHALAEQWLLSSDLANP